MTQLLNLTEDILKRENTDLLTIIIRQIKDLYLYRSDNNNMTDNVQKQHTLNKFWFQFILKGK